MFVRLTPKVSVQNYEDLLDVTLLYVSVTVRKTRKNGTK
jgi:hypothetical protein